MTTQSLETVLVRIEGDTEPLKKSLKETTAFGEEAGINVSNAFDKGFSKNIESGLQNTSSKLATLVTKSNGDIGDHLKGLSTSLHQDITKSLIRNQILSPMKSFMFEGLFPGRATGGNVSAKQPYLVGERGPELFVPHGGGHIEPRPSRPSFQEAKSHQPLNITFNVNAQSGEQFAESQGQVMAEAALMIHRALQYA
jgi:hypothetical protein